MKMDIWHQAQCIKSADFKNSLSCPQITGPDRDLSSGSQPLSRSLGDRPRRRRMVKLWAGDIPPDRDGVTSVSRLSYSFFKSLTLGYPPITASDCLHCDQSQLGPESSSVTQLTVEARAFTSLGLNKSDVNLSQSEHNSLVLLTWP